MKYFSKYHQNWFFSGSIAASTCYPISPVAWPWPSVWPGCRTTKRSLRTSFWTKTRVLGLVCLEHQKGLWEDPGDVQFNRLPCRSGEIHRFEFVLTSENSYRLINRFPIRWVQQILTFSRHLSLIFFWSKNPAFKIWQLCYDFCHSNSKYLALFWFFQQHFCQVFGRFLWSIRRKIMLKVPTWRIGRYSVWQFFSYSDPFFNQIALQIHSRWN